MIVLKIVVLPRFMASQRACHSRATRSPISHVRHAGRDCWRVQDDLFIMEEDSEPPVCRPERLFVRHAIPRLRSDVTVNLRGSVWELELDFGQVQPGAESWTADELSIGALDTMEVLCRAV